MDSDKAKSLDRALHLLDLLTPDRWQSSKELGAAVGVNARTIKGYTDVFKRWGWPVESRDGRAGGYRLEYLLAKNLNFSSSELIAFAIFSCQGSSVLPPAEAEKLKAKLKALLSEPARRHVDALEESVSTRAFTPSDWELVEHVEACLRDRRNTLVLDYQKPSDPQPSRREVSPLGLRFDKQVLYLDLVELSSGKTKSFRFDRIHRATRLRQDQAFEPPSNAVVEHHKWDFGEGGLIRVDLEVTASLARWLQENPEHPSQEVRSEGDRHFVSYQVKRLGLFADWVMSLRGARVVGPEELRAAIVDRAQAWLGADGTLGVPWETG